MRPANVLHILGFLLVLASVSLLLPALVSVLHDEPPAAFLWTALIGIVPGTAAWRLTRIQGDLRMREATAIVALGWALLSLLGSLPFIIGGTLPRLADAYFETMSGFSTTGASVFAEVESLPRGILFWRALTHWIGGMGIILLSVAILPFLGAGGMALFRAEAPGPVKDRLAPRVTGTAKRLWAVYAALSAALVLLLAAGGMSLFDAICHSFATLATGGFSTRNLSIGAWGSAYIEWITVLFMLLAGTNFSLHFRTLRQGPRAYWNDREFRAYLLLAAGCTAFLAVQLLRGGEPLGHEVIRDSAFTLSSIVTTTGFATADFSLWSPASQLLLLGLMLLGACAGSTAGGMKVVRLMILVTFVRVEIRKHLHPTAVIPVRVGDTVVSREVLQGVLGFVVLLVLLFFTSVLALAALGLDLVTATSSVAACLGNVGPGLGRVGPMAHYGHLPEAAKWILSFLMLTGRLEIYTVLMLFAPSYWRK